MDQVFFQIGMVVDSIEVARGELERHMGTAFTEVQTIDMHVLVDGEVVLRQIEVCFSKHQRPHTELIGATGSPWHVAGAGVHHVAAWSDDVEADIREVVAGGGRLVARRVDSSGNPIGFAYVKLAGDGPVIELLDRRRRGEVQQVMGDEVFLQ